MDDTLGDHRRSALQRRDLRHGAVVVIRHLVQAGDVDTRQLGRRTEKLRLAPALPAGLAVQLHQLHGDVLSLPQTHQIDEVGNGFGVIHGGAAGDDQRRQTGALCAMDGDARQIQHIQNGRKGHLIAHGKGHDIKVRDRLPGLQGKQGHPGPAHLLLHVPPRGKDPLAPYTVHVVHDAVEDPHPQIGHSDLVGVREAEGDAGVHLRRVLFHSIIFPTHITGRLLHSWQNTFQSFIHSISPVFFGLTSYFTRFIPLWQALFPADSIRSAPRPPPAERGCRPAAR